jgi:hypothetical protein
VLHKGIATASLIATGLCNNKSIQMPESYGLVLKYGAPKQGTLFGNSIIYAF